MHPEPFNPSFGVPPSQIALAVSVHCLLPPFYAMARADYIYTEAVMSAFEVRAEYDRADAERARFHASPAKHGVDRNTRRAIRKSNPALHREMNAPRSAPGPVTAPGGISPEHSAAFGSLYGGGATAAGMAPAASFDEPREVPRADPAGLVGPDDLVAPGPRPPFDPTAVPVAEDP
jgi:hypothetical protein